MEVASGNPCTDSVMLELSVAYFLFGTSITMVEILMAITLLDNADFGMIESGDAMATQKKA